MSNLWKKEADPLLEPDISGFGIDCLNRAKELIAIGEKHTRRIASIAKTTGASRTTSALRIKTFFNA